jgi:hypothetical protein
MDKVIDVDGITEEDLVMERMFAAATEASYEYVADDETTVVDLREKDNFQHSMQWWRRRLDRMVREGKATKRMAARRSDNREIMAYKLLDNK